MKSIKKNFAWNAILKVSAVIFPLITYPYVSRAIGAEGIGKVSFATSVVSYFSIIAQLGIPTYGIRCCAQVSDDKEELSKRVQEILIINIITTVIAYFILFVSIGFVPKLRSEKGLLLITSLELLFNAIGVVWLFSGIEEYSYITIRSLIFKMASLFFIILMVKNPSDYIIYGGILVAANVGSNIFNFFYSRKFVTYKHIYKLNVQQHIKPIFTFFTMAVATTIYTSLDTIMLGFMVGDVQVGFYTSATKVRSVLLGFVNALSTVLMPRASFYIKNHQDKEFISISKKAFDCIVVCASSLWFFFTLFSRECIVVLSGNGFEGAIPAMVCIMPTVFICGISNLTALQVLVPLGKEKGVLVTQIIGAILDFIFNAIFIPTYGATAAAIATTFAETVIAALQIYMVYNAGVRLVDKETIVKSAISNGIAIAVCLTVSNIRMAGLIKLAVAAVIYYSAYITSLFVLHEKTVIQIAATAKMRIKKR